MADAKNDQNEKEEDKASVSDFYHSHILLFLIDCLASEV
jgi:hypothetical protein